MVVILPSHEFIYKLVGSFYNFIDLFYLLLFDFFISSIDNFFILTVLLNRSSKRIRKGISVRFLDWRIV